VQSETAAPLALVTGSSAGIGHAVCERLLEQGWQVLGWDRQAADRPSHPGYRHQCLDLSRPDELAAAVAVLPPVTALVHAAGWMQTAPLGQLDLGAGDAMWQVHVQAAVQIAQAVVPAMRQRHHGRVVLIGSRVAQGMAGRSQYAGVKAALIAMARSWAAEVAPDGVTVNVVSPAATRTAMLDDPARAASLPKVPPMGRYIEPGEVADLVAFLLGGQAAAITGQDISICGGSSLR
jgi:3-oxoacyl-[acyl-carrier protein] reductase